MHSKNSSSPLKRPDNSWTVTEIEKANISGIHLFKICQLHSISFALNHLHVVNNSLESALLISLPAKFPRENFLYFK